MQEKGVSAADTLSLDAPAFEYLPASQVAHVSDEVAPARAEPSVVCVSGHAKKLVRLGDTKSGSGEGYGHPPFP